MLTVKHINIAGAESIYSAFSVEFRPAGYPHTVESDSAGAKVSLDRVLAFTEDRFVIAELTGGTVFVMNVKGQTVSRYDLGASPVPLTREAA